MNKLATKYQRSTLSDENEEERRVVGESCAVLLTMYQNAASKLGERNFNFNYDANGALVISRKIRRPVISLDDAF